MKRAVTYGLLPALLFIMHACAGTSPNILTVQAGPDGVSAKKTEINDSFLARALTFGEVEVTPLGDGSLVAQVLIRNENSTDVPFEYRFIWYDAKGFEQSTATAWIPAVLTGKEARGFKSVAPGPKAVSFKVMVRKPHPVNEAGSQ